MKKVTKVLALALAAVFVLAAFSGCGSSSNKLVMATNASFPPYEYVDGGKIVGIDAEVAEKIAEKLGMELEIVDTEFGSIIGGVTSGKYDMGMAGMTVTEERKQSVNFSETYAIGVQAIIVPENSEYKSVDDFYNADGSVKAELKIGVQQDTTGDIYASDTVDNGGFGEEHVTRYKTGNDAVQALVSGKVNVVIIDNEPAKSYVASNSGLVILDAPYTEEEYAIAVAKDNEELLDKINTALKELEEDGTLQEIIDKYIPAE